MKMKNVISRGVFLAMGLNVATARKIQCIYNVYVDLQDQGGQSCLVHVCQIFLCTTLFPHSYPVNLQHSSYKHVFSSREENNVDPD